MKAVIINNENNNQKIKYEENYPLPQIINQNEVLIKIIATAVNPIDFQIFNGKNEAKSIKSNILGRELSGIIVERGKLVENFNVGDEIYTAILSMGSNGSFAQYVVAPENIVALKPKTLNFVQSASLPVSYITAWQIFTRLNIEKHTSTFIIGGTTSVGKAVINILTKEGFSNIFATAGNIESVEILLKLGIKQENIISYRSDNFLNEAIISNRNSFFDVVIDCVGSKMSELGSEILKREGIYVDVTNLKTVTANNSLFRKATNIMNIARYETPNLFYKYGENLKYISEFIDRNKYVPEILHLGELNADNIYYSFELLEKNLTKSQKLILSNS